MKYGFFSLLLLLSLSAGAQTTLYQPFEVDSAAEPRGGILFFNTFIQNMVRKPVSAQAEGLGGRIVVEGVVEPDGRISNVKALQRIRPDLDNEAVRIFSLFNAWKPGQKNGQPVRQRVTMPIMFQQNSPFVYTNGIRITYFSADNKVITDSSRARYKQMAPIDINGVPTGDIIVYELRGKGWKEYGKMPLIRRKSDPNSAQPKRYTVGNQNYKQEWEGNLFVVDEAGTILEQGFYSDGKRNGTEMKFYPNGAIAEKNEEEDGKTGIMTWYPNGQIKQIKTAYEAKPLTQSDPELVTAYWDSTGHQQVVEGKGKAIFHQAVRSYVDTTQRTLFVEQGLYENGFKQGIWTGRYVDGSYFYKEHYDKGVCTGGKAIKAGADSVQYSVPEQQAEFIGSYPALGEFLAKNLRYPVDAQRANVSGRVFTSFMINTNGAVTDVQVLKGLGFGCDEETVRVIKAMSGYWKPGIHRGEKIRLKYNLPINFILQ